MGNLKKKLLLLIALTAPTWAWLFFSGHVIAQSNTAIAQGFQTEETNLGPGAIMSLSDSPDSVVLADLNNKEKLVGVLDDLPLLELDGNDKPVQIVTGGITQALVSDINGEIKTGDKIAASPIKGVGMKATESTVIVGTAQSSFDTAAAATRTITQSNGQSRDVKVGVIPVQVNVTFYQTPSQQQTVLPPILNDIAGAVAGKQVSPVRIVVALLVLLVALVAVSVLLYSSVKSSVISIGRNPLSEHAVYKSLWQIGLIALGILLLTLGAVYLVLAT